MIKREPLRIIMSGNGDTYAMLSFKRDGYVGLKVGEIIDPVGVGNKPGIINIHPYELELLFNNTKSVDVWIKWLQDVKLALDGDE